MLRATRTIAVLGAHVETRRAAHYVPAYMVSVGYEILPVNPHFTGSTLFGAPVVASLDAVEGSIDAVVVFRRPSEIGQHVAEVLALEPGPRVVWLQQGIRHAAAAEALKAAGIDVVQDRCIMVDHRRLVGDAPARKPRA